MVTQKRVKQYFNYDTETGMFIRRFPCGKFKKGSVAGCSKGGKYPYIEIYMDGVKYSGHKLAWLYVHGWIPNRVGFFDRDGTNNRIANLYNMDKPKHNWLS